MGLTAVEAPTSSIDRLVARTKSFFTKMRTPELPQPAQSPNSPMSGAPQWWQTQETKKAKMAARGETPKRVGQQQQVDIGANVEAASPGHLTNSSPPGYLIYRADVYDLEAYKTNYLKKTTEIITKFGGRWLARGGKRYSPEGSENPEDQILQRMVLIEFPTVVAAKAFFHSEEYQLARRERLSIASADLMVLEGMGQSFLT